MFSHNEKFYGKIQDLNNHYRYQAKQEINSGRFKLQSLKTNSGISNIKRKTLIIGSPDKNRSNLNSSNQSRGNSTPIGVSPLHRKVTVRINTTKSVPRKAETMNKRHSFFGSIKNSPLIKSPYDDYEDRKVIEDSMEDNTTVKESIKVQKAVKPEVTISEFDITKKWYDYEKKIGSDLKLPTSLGKKGNVNNKIPQFSPMTICEDISIQSNLKVQRKLTSNLNPLVNKSNIRKSAITPNANDYDDQKISNPKRVSTKMLSITSFGNNNNLSPELKCCDCHPRDIECSKIQLEIELSKSREAEHILKQEISQLRELNRQLIDKLHNYEEHEATVLDKHLEYDRIQEGFDKICQNFSDANDPSLGNLSVRGATKKMLLNLQQFAYEQIAGLKISYTFKLENLKEDYAEELESVYEALSTSALAANQLKAQEMTCDNTKENVVDNSDKIIEELTQNLQAETDRANLVTTNLDKCNLDLTDMKSKFEDLSNKFEKLKEKCDREIDIKMDYKERLEEIENKYQNISISSLHSRISSLKSQLDLQKLEDAKKIYDTNLQNKKLKKAIEALKSFKDTRAKKGNKDGEGDDEEEEADIEESLSPDKIDGNIAEIPPKLAEESEDEDPEEIERKIKKMLQEEEERKKEEEERAKEVPVTDMDDDAYKVDRQNFEKAILNNPHLDGMY